MDAEYEGAATRRVRASDDRSKELSCRTAVSTKEILGTEIRKLDAVWRMSKICRGARHVSKVGPTSGGMGTSAHGHTSTRGGTTEESKIAHGLGIATGDPGVNAERSRFSATRGLSPNEDATRTG